MLEIKSRKRPESAPRSSFLNIQSTILLKFYQVLAAEKHPNGYAQDSKITFHQLEKQTRKF